MRATKSIFSEGLGRLKTTLALIILGSLAGCTVEEVNICNGCTIIKGKILTDGGATPISDMKLELSWSSPCVGCIFGGGHRDVAITKTDAEGNYEFAFHPRKNELEYGAFIVSFDYPGVPYFDVGFYDSYFSIKITEPGTTNLYNYQIPKVQNIELTVPNREAIGAGDYLVIQSYFKYANLTKKAECCYLNSTRAGMETCHAAANQYNYFVVTKMKNGIKSVATDSVYVSDMAPFKYEAVF